FGFSAAMNASAKNSAFIRLPARPQPCGPSGGGESLSKPNTSHGALHHLAGVRFRYEVPPPLVEQGAQVSGWTMAQSAAMSITVHLCSAAAARIWPVPLPRIGSR